MFDTVVHLGRLDGPRERFVARATDLPALDEALRVEVLSGLLATAAWHPSYAVWLTRAGVPEPHDEDLAWLAAARLAFAAHGHGLDGFYAVTRTGWLDLLSGARQTWKRLRL